jgi:putative ABC transport system permease protein
MFKNYLKNALRNLQRNKIYSLIIITGLAVGLAIFILFAVIAGFNTEADHFHKNADRIYAVVQVCPSITEGEQHTAFTPSPLLPALLGEFSQIEAGARAFPAGRMIIQHKENIFYESNMLFADSDFLSMFSFDLIAGDPSQVLAEPFSIVITERMAYKYFGDADPLGETLMLNNEVPVAVSGILKNVDDNYSSIQFDCLVSMETAEQFVTWMDDWRTNHQGCFLLLSEGTDPAGLEKKFPIILKKYYANTPDTPKKLYLLPLLDFRLHSERITSFWLKSDGFVNYFLMISGTLILFIVCVNFVNLSTARYMNRIKEVGLRKVVGAQRLQLMKQFLSESVITAIIALPIAVVIYDIMVQAIQRFLLQDQGELLVWNHPFLYKYLFPVTILVGLFAGLYPAIFLSSFRPVQLFKRNIKPGKKGSLLRKLLVVCQFAGAILLIVLTLHWKRTHNYLLNVDLGYNRKNIIAVGLTKKDANERSLLQERINRRADIISVSATEAIPISWGNEKDVIPEGLSENEAFKSEVYDVDYGFTGILDITMKQGRGFLREYNDEDNVIINEILADQMKWTHPIGKKLTIEGETKKVIGVATYFHFKSVNYGMGPAVLRLNPENCNYLLIRYSSASRLRDIIGKIEEDWRFVIPNHPLESTTMENYFSDDYRSDRVFLTIFGFVDGIVIFISCLGLLGLASYTVQRRTKEIGIRKTLGASVAGIIQLLMREFMILVIIANLIAIPISYFLCQYLFQYRLPHYRASLGVNVFVLTSFITLFTAVIAIVYQTQRAARANPVEALRYE